MEIQTYDLLPHMHSSSYHDTTKPLVAKCTMYPLYQCFMNLVLNIVAPKRFQVKKIQL